MNNRSPSWLTTAAAALCSSSIVFGLGYLFLAVLATR